MKLKTLRVLGILAMMFCAFQLGRIDQDTQHKKALIKCVKIVDADLQTFYGHGFKEEGLMHTIWNHAVAHNANIYLKCIQKELNK